jgi:hypothetical protein
MEKVQFILILIQIYDHGKKFQQLMIDLVGIWVWFWIWIYLVGIVVVVQNKLKQDLLMKVSRLRMGKKLKLCNPEIFYLLKKNAISCIVL